MLTSEMNLSRFSLDHFQGCLVGGAVGDALGAPLEFLTPNKFLRLTAITVLMLSLDFHR